MSAECEHGHVVAESSANARDELGRQGDLGDEHEGTHAALARHRQRAQVDLGLAATGHSVEDERRGFGRCDSGADRGDRRLLRWRRSMRKIADRRIRERRFRRRLALFEARDAELDESADCAASVAPALSEPGERLRTDSAHVGEDRGSLAAQRARRLHIGRGDHPEDPPVCEARGRIEEVRGFDLPSGVAIDRRKCQAHDLPEGCEVVEREIAEEREQVFGNRGRLIDESRNRSHAGRCFPLLDRKHDPHQAARAHGTDDAGARTGSRRQLVGHRIRERVIHGKREGDIDEEHARPISRAVRATHSSRLAHRNGHDRPSEHDHDNCDGGGGGDE